MINVNGEPLELDGLSIASLLGRLHIETRGVAVALNGDVVPRGEWTGVVVAAGDRVEIVTAAAGG
ncbi:MAG: sulfur carrier protein ThiS [Acidimicrobiales bacterium]